VASLSSPNCRTEGLPALLVPPPSLLVSPLDPVRQRYTLCPLVRLGSILIFK